MDHSSDISDEELMSRLQSSGDKQAFDMLVDRHSAKFYGLAWKTCPNIEEAEDIVQDAYLKLWSNPYAFDVSRGVRFTTWFYRVVVNLALDRVKKKKPMPDNDMLNLMPDDKPVPDKELEAKQQQNRLEAAIHDLPDRQKTAINLCFSEGISNKEAAEIMEVSVKALESLLMRAKTTLREMMVRQGYMEDAA